MSIDPAEDFNNLIVKVIDIFDGEPDTTSEIEDRLRMILEVLQNNEADDDFEPEKSHAWEEIEKHFGENFSHLELIRLAFHLSQSINEPISRRTLQKKALIVKWIDNYINECLPFFSNYV